MQVGSDEHDRDVARDGVEECAGRGIRPTPETAVGDAAHARAARSASWVRRISAASAGLA